MGRGLSISRIGLPKTETITRNDHPRPTWPTMTMKIWTQKTAFLLVHPCSIWYWNLLWLVQKNSLSYKQKPLPAARITRNQNDQQSKRKLKWRGIFVSFSESGYQIYQNLVLCKMPQFWKSKFSEFFCMSRAWMALSSTKSKSDK